MNVRRIVNKYKNIGTNIIVNNIKNFINFQLHTINILKTSSFIVNLYRNDNFSSIINSYNFYIRFFKKNQFQSISLKNSKKTVSMMILNFKSQLYSSILKNSKLIKLTTNGFFLKKLELEKCQKKNDKLSILNLRESQTQLMNLNKNSKNINNSTVLNVCGTNTKLFKLINFFKKKTNDSNFLVYFTPKISYSKIKFKKIKSIKRKLTKKYNKLIKN
jgi:hypothetical protein